MHGPARNIKQASSPARGSGATRIAFLANAAFVGNDGIGRYQGELSRRFGSIAGLHVIVSREWFRRGGAAHLGSFPPNASVGCLDKPGSLPGMVPGILRTVHDRWDFFREDPIGKAWTARLHVLLGAYLDKIRPELFHANANFVPVTRRPLLRVLTVHDTTPLTHPSCHRWSTLKLFLKPSELRPEDQIITDSESGKRDFLAFFEHPEAQIHVIPCGVDTQVFTPGLAGAAHPCMEPRYILTVGTIEPRKNLLRGLQAFERLQQWNPRLEWWLAGGRGWGWNEFARALERSRARGNVRVLPLMADAELAEIYRGASAVFFPSVWEGFGLPVIEGFASGTPVVASDIPVFREIGQRAVRHFDPLDPQAMAEVVNAVLGDPETRGEMTRDGLQRSRRYGWERIASEMMQVYAEVLGLSSVEELTIPGGDSKEKPPLDFASEHAPPLVRAHS